MSTTAPRSSARLPLRKRMANPLPCGCTEPHSHQAWLEATIELSRLQQISKTPFDWRRRRALMWELIHDWDAANAGKIDL